MEIYIKLFCLLFNNRAILIYFRDPRVPTNVWSHVAFTWGRALYTGKLYINGVHYESRIADISTETVVDLKNSGHTIYDIGLKRDSGDTTPAYFGDLMVFNRELSETEIRNDLFINHPLHNFI